MGVREICREYLLMSLTGFSLGTGTTSASSRMRESQLRETEVSTVVTGQARISADSCNNQLGIPPSAQLPSYG